MGATEQAGKTPTLFQSPKRLGSMLRVLRKTQDLTVEKLAEMVGLSKGYISLVESGKRTPHWGTVFRIVHALDETFSRFLTLALEVAPPEEKIRSGPEHLIVVTGSGPDEWGYVPNADTDGYTWILTPYHADAHSTAVRFRLPPHSSWTSDPIAYPALATAFGMDGRMLLEVGETARNEFVLDSGNTTQFNAERPHRFRNFTDHPAECLLVVAPARF